MKVSWIDVSEELTEMDQELQWPSEEVTSKWIAIGSLLPNVITEGEYDYGPMIDRAVMERLQGIYWPDDLSDLSIFLIKLRLEWAQSLVDTMIRCRADHPDPKFLEELLSVGWEDGGFLQTHASSLQRLLNDALLHTRDANPGEQAG